MKRQALLAASGLVALLAATSSSAQTAGPKAPFIGILDGEVNGNLGIISGQQNVAHDRDVGMEQNAWMRFFFEAKADNGLTYGWYVRMLGTSSAISSNGFNIDREAIYFKHAWGTVEIGGGASGAKDSIPFVTADWGPPSSSRFYLGPDGGLEPVFIRDPLPNTLMNSLSKIGADNFDIRRTMHIFYGSPVWSGFSFDVSYAPDGQTRNEEQFVTSTAGTPISSSTVSTAQYQTLIDGAIKYAGTFGTVAWRTGVDYVYGQSKNVFSTTGSTQANNNINAWHAGLQANVFGFQWGLDWTYAGYSAQPHLGNLNRQTSWGWSTGLEYFLGPWTVGGYYWFLRAPGIFAPLAAGATVGGQTFPVAQTANGTWEMNVYGLGVGYTLAPGLKVYEAGFYYSDYNTHVVVGGPSHLRHPSGQAYITGVSVAW